jgi:hypothetical protein
LNEAHASTVYEAGWHEQALYDGVQFRALNDLMI